MLCTETRAVEVVGTAVNLALCNLRWLHAVAIAACSDLHLESEEGDDVVFYILLRGVDRFYEEYNRYPGLDNDHVELDIPKLRVSL